MFKSTRDASDKQEKRLAKKLKGKVTSNSGATCFGGGDILTKNVLIEAKTAMQEKSSFSIKKSWVDKIKEQAYEQGKHRSSLAFEFQPYGDTYFIISENMMIEYLALLDKELAVI